MPGDIKLRPYKQADNMLAHEPYGMLSMRFRFACVVTRAYVRRNAMHVDAAVFAAMKAQTLVALQGVSAYIRMRLCGGNGCRVRHSACMSHNNGGDER